MIVNYKFYFDGVPFEEKDEFKFIVGDLDVIQGLYNPGFSIFFIRFKIYGKDRKIST